MRPEKTAAAVTAAGAYHGDRRRQATTARSASSGTAHTQWCSQDIGETSRPVTAQQAAPPSRWPRWWAQAAMAIPASPVSSSAASHQE
jgi:hypothetical protein